MGVGSAALAAAAFSANAEEQTGESDAAWANILRGKVAVATGAARGIGRAAAIGLARSGATIAGIDICATVDPRSGVTPATREDLDETGRLVQAAGGKWEGFVVDQRNLPALRATAAKIEQYFGRIDILFANAGIQAFRPLLEMEDPDWHIQIDVNLSGTANAIRAFAPAMVRQGTGRIILTTSTQGRHGTMYGAAYSASKWGIIGLMKSAALELGKYKITVNALVPGLIDTPLTRHEERFAQVLEIAGRVPTNDLQKDEEAAKKILETRSPLRVPWIDPADLAPVVVFLASDASRMVSGATYDVTGGDSANNAA
ncbi:SDR family oxidoreductase [Alloacidobacterium dinghuense]|uniref:SDR family oxidoreductase n=1 Tax=Alloacidobacterium dinghuense TaxID=2763107 RepID=A0A7G8BCA2_9BACT|nr:SDR family NAD(P)-dependent oxidoreductase [Alloacidobacterium dinghuense]QNI30172.1 SDR family oxidoreductase [Alloacidobacterium dinghuense]